MTSPAVPVINNTDAAVLSGPDEIKESLIRQLNNPLLWEDSVKVMIDKGVDTFIEVGHRKVLSGLIRRISRDVKTLHVDDTKSLDETLSMLSG
jgi:[acyl-carrier-protein] S-malonyltransferase